MINSSSSYLYTFCFAFRFTEYKIFFESSSKSSGLPQSFYTLESVVLINVRLSDLIDLIILSISISNFQSIFDYSSKSPYFFYDFEVLLL